MIEKCRYQLEKIKLGGTDLNIKMAKMLLQDNVQFRNIDELKTILNVPISSISRFVRRIGYPSFQVFMYDYLSDPIDPENKEQLELETKKQNEVIIEISNCLKAGLAIHIITSRRDKAIGKFLNERINDASITNSLYHESANDIDRFINNIKSQDVLLMIDMTGESNIISLALQKVAETRNQKQFNVVVITAAKWITIFQRYSYVHVERLIDEKIMSNADWIGYNNILKTLMPIFIDILNLIKTD